MLHQYDCVPTHPFNTVVVVVPECTKYIRACNTRTHVHIQDAFVITMANIVRVVIACNCSLHFEHMCLSVVFTWQDVVYTIVPCIC